MKNSDNQHITNEIDFLKNIANSASDETKICEAYKRLGEIGEELDLDELTNLLIEKYVVEKNDSIKDVIHSAIRKQKINVNTNVKPLIYILEKYKKISVIESIVELLHNSTNSEVEDALIKILENNHSEWIYKRVNKCLHSSGSRKSIPYLVKKINHKSNDVALSSLITIIHLGDKRESELFINELMNGKNKDTAMEGICLYSEIEGVNSVLERIKKKTTRKRETDCSTYFYAGNENETTIGLKYLNRYKDNIKEIETFFCYLLQKRIDKLFDYEIETLKELMKTPSSKLTLTKRIFN